MAAKPKLTPVPVAPPADVAEAPRPAKKSRLLLMVLVTLVIGASLGGGAWYVFGRAPVEAKADGKAEAHAEKKPPPAPTFATLEPFTVNLLEENGDHYLQIGIVYQVADAKTVDTMKLYMPVLRNRILLALSSKRPSELAPLEGKQKLVAELVIAARQSLPGEAAERGIQGAFLSAFVIQ